MLIVRERWVLNALLDLKRRWHMTVGSLTVSFLCLVPHGALDLERQSGVILVICMLLQSWFSLFSLFHPSGSFFSSWIISSVLIWLSQWLPFKIPLRLPRPSPTRLLRSSLAFLINSQNNPVRETVFPFSLPESQGQRVKTTVDLRDWHSSDWAWQPPGWQMLLWNHSFTLSSE